MNQAHSARSIYINRDTGSTDTATSATAITTAAITTTATTTTATTTSNSRLYADADTATTTDHRNNETRPLHWITREQYSA